MRPKAPLIVADCLPADHTRPRAMVARFVARQIALMPERNRRILSSSGRLRSLLWVLLGCAPAWAASTDEDFERCRKLRLSEPATALLHCQSAAYALQSQQQAESAFEAWMHAAALASQLGQAEQAEAAIDHAVLLLPEVHDRLAAFRLARRRGLNAYREAQPVPALARFLEAQAIARAIGDQWALAVAENDLGVIYRRLGSYPAALEHFETSLHLYEAVGEPNLGALSANIGKLYLELGDLPRAENYLQRALISHREHGRSLLEHQTLEELARLAQREHRTDAARDALDQAWDHFSTVRSPRDQLRLALHRAELEHEAGDSERARHWLSQARELARALPSQNWLAIERVSAALSQTPDEQRQAYEALSQAVTDEAGAEPERVVQAHAELAALAQALGRLDAAIDHLRDHHRLSTELEFSRHGERFDALRVRFDLERLEAEHERMAAERAQQDAELARRRTQTVLVSVIAGFALILLWMHFRSRQHRQRMRADAERRDLERRIADSRRAAGLLRSDLRSMSWLLDRQQAAAVVFDAAGTIRAITRAAAGRLGADADQVQGQTLANALDPDIARWAQALVETASLESRQEDAVLGAARFESASGALTLQCRCLALEEELGVLMFEDDARPDAASDGTTAEARTEQVIATTVHDEKDTNERADADIDLFRERLVELMQTSLEVWERSTRRTRIDLAEASGVWRITIDDGRLRVRAMDRYLRLDTLPERPRWREVLRTAYFVLSEAPVDDRQRQQLETMIDAILQQTRQPVTPT